MQTRRVKRDPRLVILAHYISAAGHDFEIEAQLIPRYNECPHGRFGVGFRAFRWSSTASDIVLLISMNCGLLTWTVRRLQGSWALTSYRKYTVYL